MPRLDPKFLNMEKLASAEDEEYSLPQTSLRCLFIRAEAAWLRWTVLFVDVRYRTEDETVGVCQNSSSKCRYPNHC